MTTFEEFRSLALKGNIIPIFEELRADTETPVSAYLKLKDESSYSFMLESVEGGEKIGRYTFLGYNPFMVFEIRGSSFTIKPRHPDVTVLPKLVDASTPPLEALKKILAHCKTVPIPGLPRFTGGAVGYFGYETIQLLEHIPSAPEDDLGANDATLMFFDTLLVFDAVKRNVSAIANAYIPEHATDAQLREEYTKAISEVTRLKEILRKDVSQNFGASRHGEDLKHLISKSDFVSGVEKAKNYIVEGDIFQVVLSQRMEMKFEADPFDLYRMLRMVNPSPYLYFLKMDDLHIVGSSPEMLVRLENGVVETRPIAGTRRRGASPQEDAQLERELLADEKECAEHLMLVDLGRNDIGRISEYGSVQVNQFMTVEKYSHVMHIVSNVRGRLRKGMTAVDALYSCFPAGTLSGAPKIRAMEIIAEIEKLKRGVYAGAIGYLDFSGNLDSCIAIRTVVIKNGIAYFQAGAGIVHDSIPEKEYQESLDKMAAGISA
ncbi:MAG TPA: anthranilate synthase component I, partial [Bacteroidota bacterium]|nr:anthranilate synthase component I [Bacteroidota bacterium]